MHPLRVAEYLQHIPDAIDRATAYVAEAIEKQSIFFYVILNR
jgi:hypothetical protein